jgi:TPR repeat protein
MPVRQLLKTQTGGRIVAKVTFIALVAFLGLAAPVKAGPIEDAKAALDRNDYSTAIQLLRPLAEDGNANAQAWVGLSFFGLRNYSEALKWFRLGADQGDEFCQSQLGVAYKLGRGVPQDYVQAHMWFNLGASHEIPNADGSPGLNARRRDELAEKMTPAQIAEAQKLAREWMSKRN